MHLRYITSSETSVHHPGSAAARIWSLIILALFLACGTGIFAQPIDYSNCPKCSPADILFHSETTTKYKGIRGTNPTVPSTYNLTGNKKFSGTGLAVTNPFFGGNWYPIRTEKQLLTGTVHSFGVSNYGDESDWNIHILPDSSFADFVTDAIPYRLINWYDDVLSSDRKLDQNGRILIEAEIKPGENRYGNPWFSNKTGRSSLLGKRIYVYGLVCAKSRTVIIRISIPVNRPGGNKPVVLMPLNPMPVVLTGTLANQWQSYADYDERVNSYCLQL